MVQKNREPNTKAIYTTRGLNKNKASADKQDRIKEQQYNKMNENNRTK